MEKRAKKTGANDGVQKLSNDSDISYNGKSVPISVFFKRSSFDRIMSGVNKVISSLSACIYYNMLHSTISL